MEWQYYDFDAHWGTFYKAWESDEVQWVLFDDMQGWCATEAYFEADGSRPTWKRGEPIWSLSRTDYWWGKLLDEAQRVDEEVNGPHRHQHFRAAMLRAANIRYIDEEDLHEAYFSIVVSRIEEDLKPKPGTLESLVLFSGRNFLHYALMATARILFGEDRVDEIEHPVEGWFVIVDDHVVMDILGYHFWKRDQSEDSAPSRFTRLFEEAIGTDYEGDDIESFVEDSGSEIDEINAYSDSETDVDDIENDEAEGCI